MKAYLYQQKEFDIIQYLLDYTPKKIWYNPDFYIFDYFDHYFVLNCSSEIAQSQNNNDEAIVSKIRRENKPFKPSENSILICENKQIERIYVVRNFLYFTTHREFSELERFLNKNKQKLKK